MLPPVVENAYTRSATSRIVFTLFIIINNWLEHYDPSGFAFAIFEAGYGFGSCLL